MVEIVQSNEPQPMVDRDGRHPLATGFSEARVASPYALLDQINKYELDTNVWGTLTSTGGTAVHVPEHSAVRLNVTSASGSRAVLQTNRYFRYQSGRELRWRWTGYHANAGVSNQKRMWGYFDENDGVFFQLEGTTLSVVQRSSTSGAPVDLAVPRQHWSVDRLDGTGLSGVKYDDILLQGNIWEGALQWLGVGNVEFYINGHLVHVFDNPNRYAAPYMRTAALPMRTEVINTGASTASSLTNICNQVQVNGGEDPPEETHTAYNSSNISVPVTERPVLSIRPAALYAGAVNRMVIVPRLLACSTEGARAAYRLVLNGTLTGASWAAIAANSGTEQDSSATALTGGQTLLRGFLPNSNDALYPLSLDPIFSKLRRALHLSAFATVQPVLTLAMVNEAAGTTLCRGSIVAGEQR